MKKSFFPALGIVAGAVLGLASFGAQAADGTITFNGTISDVTCSINGGASGTQANDTVVLPTVAAGSLASAGATGGISNPSDIVFALSGCTGTATKAVARFENGPTVDQTTGNLVNQAGAGGATNVQVQLLNAAMQPINITTNANNDLATNGGTITAGNANLTYFGRYFATGAASAGTVNTIVQYTMDYQ